MNYQFIPYVIFLAFSAGITIFLCIYSTFKIRGTGQTAFSIWMFICSYWSVCNALELMGTSLAVKLFWANMQYAAYSLFPVCLLILVLQLTGFLPKVSKRMVLFLLIIPVITTTLVWFDRKLGLVRYDFVLYWRDANYSFIKKKYGPWFIVHTVYTYGLYVTSIIILIHSILLQKKLVFKRQQLLLLIGIIIDYIPNILYITGLSPIKRFDTTPVFFSVTGVLVLLSMAKYRFLNIIPVAREAVFDNMGEGIIVTDIDGKILDINKRACTLFNLTNSKVSGKYIQNILPVLFTDRITNNSNENTKDLLDVDRKPESTIICVNDFSGMNKGQRFFERSYAPLEDIRSERIVGWIYSAKDVTDLHKAQLKVWQQQQELAVSKEQQRVARDLHDNIGQILSFSGIQIQTIQRELTRGNTELVAQYLDKLKKVMDQLYMELREYIFNLRQPNMQSVSFKEFITTFTSQIGQLFSVECVLQLQEEIPACFDSAEVKSHLSSLTKEAVNNSIKHAEASKIIVGLKKREGNKIVYYIEDNGKGLNLAEQKRGTEYSSGIRIMEERALLTGGKFEITSESGKGTTISVIYDGDIK